MTNDMTSKLEMIINGKKVNTDDFGLMMDVDLDSEPSACSHKEFVPVAVAPRHVLKKYGITETEFRGIQRELECRLSHIHDFGFRYS